MTESVNEVTPEEKTEVKEELKTPSPLEFAEALDPELSDDFVTVCGKKIKLKPLKIKYQLKLVTRVNKIIGSFGKAAAFKDAFDRLMYDDLLSKAVDSAMEATSDLTLLLELIVSSAENDGVELTVEQLMEQDDSLLDFAEIARKVIVKQNWGQEIRDFFDIEVPKLLSSFKEMGKEQLANVKDLTGAQTTST